MILQFLRPECQTALQLRVYLTHGKVWLFLNFTQVLTYPTSTNQITQKSGQILEKNSREGPTLL